MMPNRLSATGSSGAIRRATRYSFSALTYCSAVKSSFARARTSSLVAGALEQAALPTSTRQNAATHRVRDREARRLGENRNALGHWQIDGLRSLMSLAYIFPPAQPRCNSPRLHKRIMTYLKSSTLAFN